MPLKISKLPILKTFQLLEGLEVDPDAPTITIRQATTGENRRRAELFSMASYIINDPELGANEIKQKINPMEIARMEAYLTLAGSTLCYDDDTPVFSFRNDKLAMSETQFNAVWDSLPANVTLLISNFVRQVNPNWAGGDVEAGE